MEDDKKDDGLTETQKQDIERARREGGEMDAEMLKKKDEELL
jgi:uncharacterized membrane protein